MSQKPIVLIDSGVGGLFLFKALKEHLPIEQFVYIADTEYFPYGNRSIEQLDRRLEYLLELARTYHPKQICLVCYTLSFIYQKQGLVPGVFGISTIFDSPTFNKDSYAILGTQLSAKLEPRVIALPDLAECIEKNRPITDQTIAPIVNTSYNYLLGCTHFSWALSELQQLRPGYKFIDPSLHIVQKLIYALKENQLLETSYQIQKDIIYTTSQDQGFILKTKSLMNDMYWSELLSAISTL